MTRVLLSATPDGGRAPVTSQCSTYYGGGACYFVGVTTENFSGTYRCSIQGNESGSFAEFGSVTLTGSASRQTTARYGYDASVRVVCDGVSETVKW